MKESIQDKLTILVERFEEVGQLLSEQDVIARQDQFRELSKEYARLEPVAREFAAYRKLLADIGEAQELRSNDDPELKALGEEELEGLLEQREIQEEGLQLHLVPVDPDDDANLFLEIRAGTGGDEAALFVGDLFRMYTRYAERSNWKVEVLSSSEGTTAAIRRSSVGLPGKAPTRS